MKLTLPEGVLSQSSIFGAKSKNRVSEIQRLPDGQTLEKATLRQNCFSEGCVLLRHAGVAGLPMASSEGAG
jgi:hypothetical protein